MKKIYIFGTGKGGERYFTRISRGNEFSVLAFLDNDSQKQGSLFMDVPVLAPTTVKQTEFDEIHIASMWSVDIKNQLTSDFGIAEEKIVVLPKRFLKNQTGLFATEEKQLIAKALVSEICSKFEADGIPLFLDAGCLLGIFRDRKFIPWDDDIDFIIQRQRLAACLESLRQFSADSSFADTYDFSLIRIDAPPPLQFFSLILESRDPDIDPTFIEINFNVATPSDGQMLIKTMYAIPVRFFSAVSWIDLHPGRASTYSDPEAYLTLIYKDWKVVRKDWSFSDYGHILPKN